LPALELAADSRQIASEQAISRVHFSAARPPGEFGRDAEPIPQGGNCPLWCPVIGVDVLSRDVGDERSISKRVAIQDQAILAALRFAAKPLATQVEPKLQRHIESGQPRLGIDADPRKIVHAKRALSDHGGNLLNAHLTAVIDLERTSGIETEIKNQKHHRFEHRPIVLVKRAIDEDVRRR